MEEGEDHVIGRLSSAPNLEMPPRNEVIEDPVCNFIVMVRANNRRGLSDGQLLISQFEGLPDITRMASSPLRPPIMEIK
jgi:hypothetical protein